MLKLILDSSEDEPNVKPNNEKRKAAKKKGQKSKKNVLARIGEFNIISY